MALVHNNVTVGTSPTILAQIPNGVGKVDVTIYNNDTYPIFVGDSAITVTAGSNQGLTIPKSLPYTITLNGNDILYGVSISGTNTGAVVVLYSA
jgi:hypothetical protein